VRGRAAATGERDTREDVERGRGSSRDGSNVFGRSTGKECVESRRAADAGDIGPTEDRHVDGEIRGHGRDDRRSCRTIGTRRIDFSMRDRRLSPVSLNEVGTLRVCPDRRQPDDGPGRHGLHAAERDAEIGENDRDQSQTRMPP
jgi:hypothetical protein